MQTLSVWKSLKFVVWERVKLDKIFFNFKDVYLSGIYLWVDGSPIYDVYNVDLFELIDNDIFDDDNLGSVYVCGDLNSRVGSRHDFIYFACRNDFVDADNYIPDCPSLRASFDKTCNSFGIRLLELCKSTYYRIVNGRLDNGMYTYVGPNGASVNDDLLSKEEKFSEICNSENLKQSIWSDHSPIQFSLRKYTPGKLVHKTEIRHVLKWNSEVKAKFRNGLIGSLPHFNNVINIVESCRM